MDHWGDPWSDNADEVSVTKTEVTSPLPPAHTSAPVLLNGFLDDAGWGNDEASFGDWATTPEPAQPTATTPYTHTNTANKSSAHDISQAGAQWAVDSQSELVLPADSRDWPQDHQDEAGADGVLSEASDSATTVQQDEDPNHVIIESSGHLQPDDDSSARPSTSLSERSHNEPPADSPRTSIEEDHGAIKSSDHETDMSGGHFAEGQRQGDEGPESVEEDVHEEANISLAKDSSNSILPKQDASGSSSEPDDAGKPTSGHLEEERSAVVHSPVKDPATVKRTSEGNAPSFDTALLDELFPSPRKSDKQEEAPEDPIFSTSGRKAWYRLTRRQTLREYNSGNADDNYIRVTWANSEIRKEVNKTVGRWAREDRLSGTGPGARASFYWDTAAPPEPKKPLGHSRTKTSVPTPRAVNPARNSLPPVTTDVPAAFNWSSAAAVDPWRLDSPALRSTPSPLAARPTMSESVHKVENREVSMRIASPDLGMREQVSSSPSETLGVASPIAPPLITPALPAFQDQWNNFSSINTTKATQAEISGAAVDDDDEWGEMVGSPILAEPETRRTISQATLPSESILALPATPPPSRSFSAQGQSADAMHASHITRLKGTISPTSAIFGAKSFIPLGVEQGPIGPAILKPVKRPEPLTFDRHLKKPLSAAPADIIIVQKSHVERAKSVDEPRDETTTDVPHLDPAFAPVEVDEFSSFASSTPPPPEPKILEASVVSKQPITDAWADADFSFFETAPPVPVPAQPQPVGPDAISIFETPTRSARSSSAASSKGYARSPPRASPPPIQPLTGATNAAQRRKDEEEKTIREILGGLPNLGYMLR